MNRRCELKQLYENFVTQDYNLIGTVFFYNELIKTHDITTSIKYTIKCIHNIYYVLCIYYTVIQREIPCSVEN